MRDNVSNELDTTMDRTRHTPYAASLAPMTRKLKNVAAKPHAFPIGSFHFCTARAVGVRFGSLPPSSPRTRSISSDVLVEPESSILLPMVLSGLATRRGTMGTISTVRVDVDVVAMVGVWARVSHTACEGKMLRECELKMQPGYVSYLKEWRIGDGSMRTRVSNTL